MKLNRLFSRRLGLGLLVAMLIGALAFVVMRSGPLAATRVTVHEVADGSISASLFGIGTVEARRAYLIGPTAAGRVLRVAVDVGDSVKAGQLLAEMDPVDLDERLAALDASIARAGSAAAAVQAQRKDALAKQEFGLRGSREAVAAAVRNAYAALQLDLQTMGAVLDLTGVEPIPAAWSGRGRIATLDGGAA